MTNDSAGPNPIDANGLCLLSLDGGGVRGLSTLYILQRIMLQLSLERDDGIVLKPCDVFDLIGGTSTGGLIAIMLGRLEMGIDECILAYTQLMSSVFGEKLNNIPVDWSGNIRGRYDSQRLKAAIEHVIEKAGAAPGDLMDDGTQRRCRTFVCTTAKDTLQVTRLRSYPAPNKDTLPATICEAALATSAATGCFESVTIGHRQFVDGAFGANNPVEEVEEEAADIWCTTSRDLKPLVKCFLSVGTGCHHRTPIDDNIFKFSKTLVTLAIKPESTQRRFMARWSNELKEKRIFRFDVDQGLQDVHMTEYEKRSLIESVTHDYLHNATQKGRIRDCILNLAGKEGKTNVEFDLIMQEYEARVLRMHVLKNLHSVKNPFLLNKAPCWAVPFERNPRFVDREELLGKLKRRLFAQGQSQRIGIFGLGGVGKTQIVLELAYRTKEMYSDCAVMWLPAVDVEALQQAYLEVARQLRIDHFDPDKEDVKGVVQRHLSQPHSGRWLLIIDNADDIDMWTDGGPNSISIGLRSFLPKSDQGVIIFTTRSTRVAQYLASANTIEIPEMDETKALELLTNSLMNKNLLQDTDSTRKLLERLTYLPLAIVQAASFVNENNTDIASYVRLLDGQGQEAIDLLSEEFEDEGRYKSIRNPIATTWLTSFMQIRQKEPLAADCLAFMACINAKDIPVCLLPVPEGVERTKAIGILSSYSFIHTSQAGSRVEMHRLVHLATRNWLRSANSLQQWQARSLIIVNEHFPFPDVVKRYEWRAAIPHALQVLQSTPTEPSTGERAHLTHIVASCHALDGRYKDAEELFLQSAECSEKMFGPDDWRTLRNRSSLAYAYQTMGHLQKSIQMFEEVLEAHQRIGGLDNPAGMDAMAKLASAYRLSGNLPRAEELGNRVVKYYLNVLGSESRCTLEAIFNMTLIYYAQGRLSDAEKLAQQSLFIMRKSLDPDNPLTISAITCLADIYMQRGRLREAEELYTEGLERGRRINGPAHPITIRDLHQLAMSAKLQGRHSEALALMTECCQLKEQVLGTDHFQTVQSFVLIESWTTTKSLTSRMRSRFSSMERSAVMLTRRQQYPRVEVLGGLYKARRQPKDDSLIREIKKAISDDHVSKHMLSD
ncbi:uncharacterized protein N7482_008973 [Penicillium canariense]|uniref:PNPLA domain-containing protein n=1 Tax=Penicillium canariense TaxID=189055 RepID=A0A9W9LJ24_9EURO|nr:uncharacterized protein N7482_008973 [Penicillium canariense]KAJ5157873.1 hypothetical protein N7482_008973 [Penicillium canariense]